MREAQAVGELRKPLVFERRYKNRRLSSLSKKLRFFDKQSFLFKEPTVL
jgi:hypothetical protein